MNKGHVESWENRQKRKIYRHRDNKPASSKHSYITRRNRYVQKGKSGNRHNLRVCELALIGQMCHMIRARYKVHHKQRNGRRVQQREGIQ